MNKNFLPNEKEESLIQIIQSKCRNEFVLIRLTKTMLDKSIIDASGGLRNLLYEKSIIDYGEIDKQEKVIKTSIVFAKGEILELKTSYYRPQSKNGDPRFWPYGFKKISKTGALVYFTYFEEKLVAIPLLEGDFEHNLDNLFKNDINNMLIEELKILLIKSKARGFIKSVSPFKRNPKDIGDTLEIELGLKLNSFPRADYKDKIEIKTKRKDSSTKDSLFSCVPNWSESEVESAADMILKYGYESKVHPGFRDLYVTVNNKPNKQGLYLEPQNKIEKLFQYYKQDKSNCIQTCQWEFNKLKQKLNDKHPTTVWLVGEEKVIDNEIYFHYQSLQITRNPIFSQFISLIGLGIISFDWRGKVKLDKSSYRDHGHGFRISPQHRKKLFGNIQEISI